MHPALVKALKKKPRLLAVFQRMRPSCHRRYSEWAGMAKDAAARERRIIGILEEVRQWGERNSAKKGMGGLKRNIIPMPAFVKQALNKSNLMADYNARPPYQRNDYLSWITRAKLEETRLKRLMQMLAELARDDAYMKMPHRPAMKVSDGGKTAKTETVNTYLAALTDDKRSALEKFRAIIKSAAPDAIEGISYRIPVFRHKGKLLVGFAAFKDHCSFFPMSLTIMKAHKAELKSHETDKGTIRFAPGKPLPATLIRKIVKARIEENRLRAESKQK